MFHTALYHKATSTPCDFCLKIIFLKMGWGLSKMARHDDGRWREKNPKVICVAFWTRARRFLGFRRLLGYRCVRLHPPLRWYLQAFLDRIENRGDQHVFPIHQLENPARLQPQRPAHRGNLGPIKMSALVLLPACGRFLEEAFKKEIYRKYSTNKHRKGANATQTLELIHRRQDDLTLWLRNITM